MLQYIQLINIFSIFPQIFLEVDIMKVCPQCRLSYDDAANVCAQCGGPLTYIPPRPIPMQDPTDHTSEFTAADISSNKVLAMVPYLFGWIGIIITLLAASTSPYAAFHVKQALKIQIVSALVTIIGAIIPIIGWIAVGVYAIVSAVIMIICFYQVCKGEAKEPPIIKNLKWLK